MNLNDKSKYRTQVKGIATCISLVSYSNRRSYELNKCKFLRTENNGIQR